MTVTLDDLVAIAETEFKSLICLDGDLPGDCTLGFFRALPLVAADGAANQLVARGLSVNLIVGDLDGVDKKILKTTPYIRLPSQDSCDFEKTIRLLRQEDMLPTIVLGMSGGYFDHIINNLSIFASTDDLGIFYSPPIIGLTLRSGIVKNISLPPNTKISLMGMPHANVSTGGLKWELNHSLLSFPHQSSCFNRVKNQSVKIQVHNGAALLMIYMTDVQDCGIK